MNLHIERRLLPCILVTCLLIAGCADDRSGQGVMDLTGDTMGTNYRIRFDKAMGVHKATEIQHSIVEELAEINAELSTWDAESWLSYFNQAPAGEVVAVPKHATRVLEVALDVNAASLGALDPTVYPLLQAWGFAEPRGRATAVPNADLLAQVAAMSCDPTLLHYDAEQGIIKKLIDGVKIDLSAAAKGYAVDQIVGILENNEVMNTLIGIGGEFHARGHNPDGVPWRLSVEVPSAWRGQAPQVKLLDQAIATSGGAHLYKRIDDQVYLHLIDPRAQAPLTSEHPVFSVSVVADSCLLADALSTAAFVLGPDEIDTLVAAYPDASFAFYLRDGSVRKFGNKCFAERNP